jgi:Rab GDP dissociation inhibitor
MAKAPLIIGEPSYFPASKCEVKGRVVRAICLLDHPVAGTDNAESAQIIIPASEVRRRNDVYVAVVSSSHLVASKGMFIAIVSTTVETNNPIAELNPGLALLGNIAERSPPPPLCLC